MADQELGQIIDALGARADLDEGDLPTDAFVILKIVKADGTVSLVHRRSESLDWITALGMITAAQNIENSGYVDASTDDT
ncbi:hypothetical protein L1I79_27405 [Strepomyces sp. STD 3.1]|nr:hypothetical protein [Streptomyces sp. STD 3.1]